MLTWPVGRAGPQRSEEVRVETLFREAMAGREHARVPDGGIETVISRVRLPSRAILHADDRRYPRYAYVLSGSVVLTDIETGASRIVNAGSVVPKAPDRSHEVRNPQAQPAELLVIDLIPRGRSNAGR